MHDYLTFSLKMPFTFVISFKHEAALFFFQGKKLLKLSVAWEKVLKFSVPLWALKVRIHEPCKKLLQDEKKK